MGFSLCHVTLCELAQSIEETLHNAMPQNPMVPPSFYPPNWTSATRCTTHCPPSGQKLPSLPVSKFTSQVDCLCIPTSLSHQPSDTHTHIRNCSCFGGCRTIGDFRPPLAVLMTTCLLY